MDTLRQRIQKAIPSVYDESLSYYEVLQKVIEALNEFAPLVFQTYEEIERVSTELLTTWKNDGTLDAIINTALFSDLEERIEKTERARMVYTSDFARNITESYDDEKLMRAIAHASATQKTLVVDESLIVYGYDSSAGYFAYNGKIKVPSNMVIDFTPAGVIQIASNGNYGYSALVIENAENVVIRNGRFIGDRATHDFTNQTYPTHEWGWGVVVYSSKDVTIENCSFKEFTGDGVYVGVKHTIVATNETYRVHIKGCRFVNCRRNGISLTAVETAIVEGCSFISTLTSDQHVSPKASIDIETEDSAKNLVSNATITGCTVLNVPVGIQVLSATNINIVGNVMNATETALVYLKGVNVRFSGNQCSRKIQVDSNDIVISDNTLSGPIQINTIANASTYADIDIAHNTMKSYITVFGTSVAFERTTFRNNAVHCAVGSTGTYLLIVKEGCIAKGLSIENNIVYNAEYGVWGCMQECTIKGNTFKRTGKSVVSFVKQGTTKSMNNIVASNIFDGWSVLGTNGKGVDIYDGTGIQVVDCTFKVHLETSNNVALGVYCWGANNTLINNRFVKDTAIAGKLFEGFSLWDANTLCHANVFQTNTATTPIRINSGASIDSRCSNIV